MSAYQRSLMPGQFYRHALLARPTALATLAHCYYDTGLNGILGREGTFGLFDSCLEQAPRRQSPRGAAAHSKRIFEALRDELCTPRAGCEIASDTISRDLVGRSIFVTRLQLQKAPNTLVDMVIHAISS